jgi:hypothetical protein
MAPIIAFLRPKATAIVGLFLPLPVAKGGA